MLSKVRKDINHILNQQLKHQQVCRRINPLKFKQRYMKLRHKNTKSKMRTVHEKKIMKAILIHGQYNRSKTYMLLVKKTRSYGCGGDI